MNKALSIKDAWRNGPRILIVAPAPIEEGCLSAPVVGEMGPDCVEKVPELASGLRMSPHAQAAAFWMPEAFRESVCIRMITCIWTGKAIRFLHGRLRNGFLPFLGTEHSIRIQISYFPKWGGIKKRPTASFCYICLLKQLFQPQPHTRKRLNPSFRSANAPAAGFSGISQIVRIQHNRVSVGIIERRFH